MVELTEVSKSDSVEIAAIVQLVNQCYPNRPWPFTAEKVLSGSTLYFKAYYQGQWFGMSGIEFKTPTLAETVKTIVKDEFRGQGLGEKLSHAIEAECRRRGIKKVMTTIYAHNHTMIAIKLKQGYTIEGYHPDHEAPGFHEYSLGKQLK
jgi:GNAT superfamily N-acetyltransferase